MNNDHEMLDGIDLRQHLNGRRHVFHRRCKPGQDHGGCREQEQAQKRRRIGLAPIKAAKTATITTMRIFDIAPPPLVVQQGQDTSPMATTNMALSRHFMHLVWQTFPTRKSRNIAHGCPRNGLHGLLREEGLVRRHQNIAESEEPRENVIGQDIGGMVFKKELAFLLIDIKPRRPHLAALECLDQRIRVNEAAASGVDDHDAGLGYRQAFLAHQMIGVLRQGTMQGNDVGLLVQLAQIDIPRPDFGSKCLIGIRIMKQDIHVKPAQDSGCDFADFPGSHNGRNLPRHVKPHQAPETEIPLPRTGISLMDLPVEGQHHANGMFGDRRWRIGRNMYHGNAAFFGHRHIHIVDARATHGDEFYAHFRKPPDDGCGEIIIHERANNVTPGGQRQRAFIQTSVAMVKPKPMRRIFHIKERPFI